LGVSRNGPQEGDILDILKWGLVVVLFIGKKGGDLRVLITVFQENAALKYNVSTVALFSSKYSILSLKWRGIRSRTHL